MAHWQAHDEDEDDDWVDEPDDSDDAGGLSAAELPDPADTAAGDDETVPCPFCREPVYEFADVCPACRNFIGGSDDPSPRRPRWVAIGLLLCLAAMLVTCVLRMW